jgi:endoglucanase
MTKSLKMLRTVILVSAVAAAGAFAQIKPQLPAPGDAPAGSPVAKYGWLKATGGKLNGSKQNEVQLKGMSLHWSNGGDAGKPFYNEDVVAWLAHDWQVDVVRAAIGARSDEGGGTAGYCDGAAAGQAALAKVVADACIMRGLYVILDFHSHAAHTYTSCAENFFKDMVSTYGKYPNVIYEIYNEPKGTDWSSYKTYSNTVISTIRTAETTAGATNANLIVVGTPFYSSQPNVDGDVTDSKSNVAYSLHFYAGASAHDGYKGNVSAATSKNRTVFVTEFGTCNSDGGEPVNTSNTDSWLTTLNTSKVSWVNWAVAMITRVDNKPQAAAILKEGVAGTSGGWVSNSFSPSGTYIRSKFPASSNRTYSVTLNQPASGGSITKDPSGSTHAYGSNVKITAVPAAGWELQSWTGDAAGGNESVSGLIKGVNLSVSAVFYNGGLVKNGHFTYSTALWSSSSATNLVLGQDNGQLKLTVANAGASADALNLSQGNIKLEKGRKYALSFSARGQSARSVTPRITNPNGTRNYIKEPKPVSLTTAMQSYTVEFEVTDPSISDAILQFDCGGTTAAWYLDDVKLVDVGAGTGVAHGAVVGRAATSWSVSRAGGAWQLRGPAEAGAKAFLYDTRGKLVKSMPAADGLTLGGAGIGAGSYLLVVKSGTGAEALRSNVIISR